MKQYNIALIFLIAALSQCLPILKSEKDDNQSLLALLPLTQPRDSTVCTSKPTTVPDFCAAAEAEFGCSVYEGMETRVSGIYRNAPTNTKSYEFTASCRGFKKDGVYAGVYSITSIDTVNNFSFLHTSTGEDFQVWSENSIRNNTTSTMFTY